MATLLYRIGRGAYRRWPAVLVGWLVVMLGVGGFAAAKSEPMSTTFSIPGVPAIQAAELQHELFPSARAADKQVTGQVVLKAPEGHTLAEQPYKGQVDALVADLAKTPQLDQGSRSSLVNPATAGPALTERAVRAQVAQGTPRATAETNASYLSPLSADKRYGTVSWTFAADQPQDIEQSTQDYVRSAVSRHSGNGLEAVPGGTGMRAMGEIGVTSEAIGIGVALIVLVLTFGSFVAAGLPILAAIIGVSLGIIGIRAATAFGDIASTTPTLASMIGLAVGIDYSLFILSRYRSELRHTSDRSHAMGRAIGTAGTAVVFAGLTVVIALVALVFSGISLLGSMGIAAACTVAIAVMVAITLLPAILGMLKGKAFAGQVRRRADVDEEDHQAVNGSVRLGQGIRRSPVVVALVATLALTALAIPAKDLHLGLPSSTTAAEGTDARRSADMLNEGFGPGKNAPMVAVIDSRSVPDQQRRAAALADAQRWAASDHGVANAQVVQATKDASGAVMLITPRTAPEDEATDETLSRLRDSVGGLEDRTGATIGITGQTAIAADVSSELADALPTYLGIVVGLAFLLLVLVFRSIWVPILATLGFVLSTLATLGVTVGLVQEGWLGIFEPQPVMSVMPTLLIGIVFGLAMDYQVFLTTRIREAYVHGMEAKDAVIDGFRHSGRVVTAAALIMISVFAAFAFQDEPLIKSIGVALATAVLLDAFLVRMILIPALLLVMGRHAWWMPAWLDRLVPHMDVEGATLATEAPDDRPVGTHREPAPDRGAIGASSGAGLATIVGSSSRTVTEDLSTTVVASPSITVHDEAQREHTASHGLADWHAFHGDVTDTEGAPRGAGTVTLLDADGRPLARTAVGQEGRYYLAVPSAARPRRITIEVDAVHEESSLRH